MEKNNLSAALARAQANISSAPKTGYNPHFKSNFSTLEDLILVSRIALTNEGISVSQFVRERNGYNYLVSQLRHGQEMIESECLITLKDPSDIQKFGSALSYLKRYMYAGIVGIATADNDDDGQSISGTEGGGSAITDKQLAYIKQLLQGQPEREAKIVQYYGLKDLSQLSWKYMGDVVAGLTRKDQ